MSTGEQGRSAPQPIAPAKFWLTSALVIVVLAVLMALAWRPKSPPEPEYAGRTLAQWLERLIDYGGNPEVWNECADAIRQIGTNGLPHLLQMLEAPEEPWRGQVNALGQRVGLTASVVKDDLFKKRIARQAFNILGPQAQSALPELLAILSRCRTSDDRGFVIESISWIGPAAEPAIPALVNAARSGGQTECYFVCRALARIARQPEISVPFLTDQLSHPDRWPRQRAADALGNFTTNAISATPELVKLLDDPVTTVRETATNALRRIDPAAATKAGIP